MPPLRAALGCEARPHQGLRIQILVSRRVLIGRCDCRWTAQSQAPAATTRRSLLVGAAALAALAGPSAAALAASRTQLFAAYYDKTEEVFDSIQRVLDLEPSEEGYAAKVSCHL